MAEASNLHTEVLSYLNQQAPVLYFTLSRQGRIVDTNAYAKTITGRDLVGEEFKDVIVDFGDNFDLTAASQDAANEQLINIATASRLPQSFYFTFRPVADHILAFGRLDAEELEYMRTEVLSLNRDLNNLTRELHKKNAQLKQLNAEKNRFLGMAAHDLRSPVGTVLSYTEFVLEDTEHLLDEEHIGFLNTIRTSCMFMRRLVDDFLDVSAIEAGKFELDRQPALLDEVLSRSLQFNTLQAKKKDIDLTVHCDKHLPHISIDAPKIQQAITNLVSNAIEHSEENGAVEIVLSANGRSVRFSVHDTGPGIAADELDKLFKPFAKASAKKTAGEKSTGLGMLITRKIIEAHAGEIQVESQVGKGTTVHFKLPIQEG